VSRRSKQPWVFMRHPETGGTSWVPDNPGVVADQEKRGWIVAEQRPAHRPVNLAARKHFEELGRQRLLLVVTCSGGNRPHDLEVLLTAGRDPWPGGIELYLLGGKWEGQEASNGLRYGAGFSPRTRPRCPRCPAKPPILAATLRCELENMMRASGSEPARRTVDFRELC